MAGTARRRGPASVRTAARPGDGAVRPGGGLRRRPAVQGAHDARTHPGSRRGPAGRARGAAHHPARPAGRGPGAGRGPAGRVRGPGPRLAVRRHARRPPREAAARRGRLGGRPRAAVHAARPPLRRLRRARRLAARDTLLGAPGSPAAAAVAGAATVFVCPDGVLHRAPFALLLAPAEPRRLPSATVLAHLRASAAPPPPQAACVLAVAGRENAGRGRLSGAGAEVARLRRRFRRVTVPSAARTDTAAFGGAAVESFDVLHFASHGEVDAQRPWNSALVFGDADRPLRVRAGDIARLDLKAQLAVLSSCGSADGQLVAGEGVPGLASGFLSAGVPAVVATLWPVDDAATSRLIGVFYDELAAGRPPAAALRAARAALRDDPATSHPFYWAGFVLLGEGDTPVRLQPRRVPRSLVAGIAVIAVAGVVAVPVLRRRRSS
ncbi:MAG: CHAT domain-containing protein [bacterium]|nr:CHAT domain-containing protein [bacterium]